MQKIIRLPEVIKTTGLSRSTLYKMMEKKTFPSQIPLGPKAVGWLEKDIQSWIQGRIDQTQETAKLELLK